MSGGPSQSALYIDDHFYRKLLADFTDWQADEREAADSGLRQGCRMLLEKEARLLEQRRYQDWLKLYAQECLYWVPATPEGGDPRRQVTIAFDDRRRLEDRVFRLQSDYAWSQRPASRTARLISNVAVFSTAEEDVLMVASTFLTSEFQAGGFRTYAGRYAHRLRRRGQGWEILVKQVSLIDCDQNLRNPSIIF